MSIPTDQTELRDVVRRKYAGIEVLLSAKRVGPTGLAAAASAIIRATKPGGPQGAIAGGPQEEMAAACCSTGAQATCCALSAKSECCNPETHAAGTCGCSAER